MCTHPGGVFKAWEGLDAKVKAYLVEIVWHHLPRIKPMFRDALGVEFPKADALFQAVLVRHDIVHRNGKKKGGGEHVLNRDADSTRIDCCHGDICERDGDRLAKSQTGC